MKKNIKCEPPRGYRNSTGGAEVTGADTCNSVSIDRIKSSPVPLSSRGEGFSITRHRQQTPVGGGFGIPLKKGGDRQRCPVRKLLLNQKLFFLLLFRQKQQNHLGPLASSGPRRNKRPLKCPSFSYRCLVAGHACAECAPHRIALNSFGVNGASNTLPVAQARTCAAPEKLRPDGRLNVFSL